MIKRVLISKSPTLSYLDMDFNPGFNVISGVSGSGKSVFLNTILSAFGLKEPQAELIEIGLEIDLDAFGIDLEDWGISNEIVDSDKEIVVSILKKSNTRYFFNRQSISKKKLSEIAKHFIHHISIKDANELESKQMLSILDDIAICKNPKHQDALFLYQDAFIRLKECHKDLRELESKEKNIESLKDFAQFEIDRISKINPYPGEYDKLLNDKKLLSKKEKVLQHCNEALQALDRLDCIYKALEILEIDSSVFESTFLEITEGIESGIDKFKNLDLDPEKLLERISQLSDINRKYGSVENALTHLELQRKKLMEYENISFDKTQLEKQYQKLLQNAHDLALLLHNNRLESLVLFEKQLNRFGRDLKLQAIALQLQCAIDISQEIGYDSYDISSFSESGYDSLEIFLDSAPKNLISSGEYNRLRLSMLCVLAQSSKQQDSASHNFQYKHRGILILDEIDANLSGEESEGVANLLSFLSQSYQIFAISHQPFMPLLSDFHYLVSKDSYNNRHIVLLDDDGKIAEIARMISGSNLDKNALSYAKTLLAQKRKNK
ncbi:DNA recombination protein RecN [Helicobacter muridarum]|uniref:DNA repair protein RecN n=1 Tax=Helicobacter muridarum TaxID=216 RepID=A0A099TYN3_9HELI|nr:AAA family ATPase [Helicobacter muridarum]TLE01369.1 DNA recombination protein RecN [Helicobacter muridarum]STQ85295.1 DNA repair protein RecN [Helicobacter muridarum]